MQHTADDVHHLLEAFAEEVDIFLDDRRLGSEEDPYPDDPSPLDPEVAAEIEELLDLLEDQKGKK